MNFIKKALQKIQSDEQINKEEAQNLLTVPLEELSTAADNLRKQFVGNTFDICTITNGKSGRCTEDCKFCSQSRHFAAQIETYPLRDSDSIVPEALHNFSQGILRFAIVTAGRTLSDTEIDDVCKIYRDIAAKTAGSLCASHGLLSLEQFQKLKLAGVERYHNNLETSRSFFPHICSTHTYNDKITAIKNAQQANLAVCSGGIIGLGESFEDRIDMALELRSLGINSIPLNILNAVDGTPYQGNAPLSVEDIRRTVALFRFILPQATIRLAGGRGLLADKGRALFIGGANATISGDMLTTAGVDTASDLKLIDELNYKVGLL